MPYTVTAQPDYSALTRGAEQLAQGIDKQKQMKDLKKAYRPFFEELGYSSAEEYDNAAAGTVLPRVSAVHFKQGIADLKRQREADEAYGNVIRLLRPDDDNRPEARPEAFLPPPPPPPAATMGADGSAPSVPSAMPPPPARPQYNYSGANMPPIGLAPGLPIYMPPPGQTTATPSALPPPPVNGAMAPPPSALPQPQAPGTRPRYEGGTGFAERAEAALAANPKAMQSRYFQSGMNTMVNLEHLREMRNQRQTEADRASRDIKPKVTTLTDPETGKPILDANGKPRYVMYNPANGQAHELTNAQASNIATPVRTPDGQLLGFRDDKHYWDAKDIKEATREELTKADPIINAETGKPIPGLFRDRSTGKPLRETEDDPYGVKAMVQRSMGGTTTAPAPAAKDSLFDRWKKAYQK